MSTGGRWIDARGYVRIYVVATGEWEYEHRHVLEKKLGRKLRFNEVAHHLNGIKSDNRPENLTAAKRGHHTSYHNSVEPKRRKGARSAYDEWVAGGRQGPAPASAHPQKQRLVGPRPPKSKSVKPRRTPRQAQLERLRRYWNAKADALGIPRHTSLTR